MGQSYPPKSPPSNLRLDATGGGGFSVVFSTMNKAALAFGENREILHPVKARPELWGNLRALDGRTNTPPRARVLRQKTGRPCDFDDSSQSYKASQLRHITGSLDCRRTGHPRKSVKPHNERGF